MGKGSILVRLFKVKDAIPIQIGKLTITTFESCDVVYENADAFDLIGRSEIIEVDAPSQDLTLQPQECAIPYGRYNILVSTYGFEDASVQGISVFEGITSIQNIELIELNQIGMPNNSVQVTIIPPHQLTLSATRDKQENTTIQPKQLALVNIPQFIVVHLGPPTSDAEDVTIGFADYIKNVASSEIYPTWPLESLKANIYCQISFALNRVYTEFYRNKGFPFQITNSTAYDQYFVKGRNIYKNLSIIVDDIFSEYIITGGSLTPLFAQFCNGTTVTCPGWLSQWGTVYLANNGLSAIEILRYYYGDDHALIRAVIIEGVPVSYPGIPLRLNDVNQYVKVIQGQLNRISVNFPLIPINLPVDGIFGKRTLNSVKTFQSIFNLVQDGIVGRATWYSISGIYAAVTQLTGLNQQADLNRQYHRNNSNPHYYKHHCPYKYNSYLRANMIYASIVSASGDINGDGVTDNVYLTGIKTPGSPFIQNITLVLQDGLTDSFTRIALSYNEGYNPTLFLGDFTGNGVDDILISINSGGSGGIMYYYIYSFINNKARLLFDFNVYNEEYKYDVTYKDNYKVEVISKRNNELYIIDISNKGSDYLNEIYDANGKLKNPINGFVNPLSGLYPVDFDSNKVYELLSYQKIAGRYNADSLGYVLNTLNWGANAFVLVNQYVAIWGSQV